MKWIRGETKRQERKTSESSLRVKTVTKLFGFKEYERREGEKNKTAIMNELENNLILPHPRSSSSGKRDRQKTEERKRFNWQFTTGENVQFMFAEDEESARHAWNSSLSKVTKERMKERGIFLVLKHCHRQRIIPVFSLLLSSLRVNQSLTRFRGNASLSPSRSSDN